ncbi:unnamed protein product [Diamesa hyperborea]
MILYSFACGFYDSIRGIFVIFILDQEMNKKMDQKNENNTQNQSAIDTTKKITANKGKKPERSKVRTRVFQCCLLNGVIFLCSILFFDYLLLPLLEYIITYFVGSPSAWNYIKFGISRIFDAFWVLPLFVVSKIINTIFFQDIADAAFEFRKGRPTLIPSVSMLIADVLFSLLVQVLFLLQSMVVAFIPYAGNVLCFLHMSLLYSLYSFEYKWFNQGYELHKRLTFIESNWPYYFGFGIVLAGLTQLFDSFFVSGCIFSMLFPLFILSGNESSPKQISCEFPLRFFSLVVTISNALFSKTIPKANTSTKR